MGAFTPSSCSDDGSMLSAGALAEATRAALSSGSSQESLQLVIALAVDTAPCDQASITMLGPGQIMQTVASSDDRITKADLLQYQLDEGPCLDAAQSDEIIVVDDMAAERRWPRWAPLAAGLGIGGLAALLLRTDTALGTLNLYSEQPRDYDDLDLEAARVVAAHASVVVAHTRTTQYLRRGMENRSLVGQAQGMLMARYRLTPEQAFAVLRRYSQHANTKITVLAEELTRTGRLPQLEPHIYASRQ
jgi:GAF domain-containing protein